MYRRFAALASSFFLAFGAGIASAGEENSLNAAPAPAPSPAEIPPQFVKFLPVLAIPPSPPGIVPPEADGRTDWSLGRYGITPRYAAADLYPPGQTVGWYAGVDLGIMKPNLKSMLTTPDSFSGSATPPTPNLKNGVLLPSTQTSAVSPTGKPISLPGGPLDWVAVPEIYLGYRLGEGAGELRLKYRLLASAGSTALPGLDPPIPAQLRTRLDVQTVDLDYISTEYLSEAKDISRFFFRDLRAGFGFRAASAFFDSHASGSVHLPDTHVSSSFGGIGPRVFFELHQDLGRPDIQLYTRMTASGVIGPIRQRFSQTVLADTGPAAGFFDTHNRNIAIGILQAEAGFSWEPDAMARRLRLSAAYSWERWWNFGRTDDSNAELTLQGLLLRAEFQY